MEKIHILGTGNAMVTECFNTCFSLSVDKRHFLVDTGGGNGILKQLKGAKISIEDIEHIFVSHNHIDHIMGAIWLIRAYAAKLLKNPELHSLYIYGHDEVMHIIETMRELLLNKKQTECLEGKLHLITVQDKTKILALGIQVEYVDIFSTKDKQFGARFDMPSGKSIMFLGDEPYRDHLKSLSYQVDYLLHEAFCLYSERESFNPYKKHHCTVKEAAENGKLLEVKNIVLYHTEEKNIRNRKAMYTSEAKPFFLGRIYVPDDLDVIEL